VWERVGRNLGLERKVLSESPKADAMYRCQNRESTRIVMIHGERLETASFRERRFSGILERFMKHTLHLTAAERARFDALPKAARRSCAVREETGKAYESADELALRVGMTSLSDLPELREALGDLHAGKKVSFDWEMIPGDVWADLLFAMGARGVSTLIAAGLENADGWTDEDAETLSALSVVRHKLLKTNASISYSTDA
jgi:hypothetical protein